AGVTVVIVGVGQKNNSIKTLYSSNADGAIEAREVKYINAYLVAGPEVYVEPRSESLCKLHQMAFGNMPIDGGYLSFTKDELDGAGI
ncbi:hypothetical protein LRN56_16150, partial [Staphylococcus aureus]|uniref:type IIL restriction-modification enzyme MmeI n=1 Tax=Staphylococcus aureus TaxID=1280 RepID=UPI001E4BD673